MSKRTADWLLATAATLLALVGAEAYLRLDPPPFVYEATRNVVQQDFSQPSDNAMLRYVPRANATGRFRNKEFDTLVSINSKSMRDRDVSYEKADGTIRIVAVGDSFVFGWGVEAEETASKVLEHTHLHKAEILNLGVSGYCDLQILERLRVDGLRFNPDLVLFFLYNDYPDKCPVDVTFVGDTMYWSGVEASTLLGRLRSFVRKNSYLFWLITRGVSDAKGALGLRPAAQGGPPSEARIHEHEARLVAALGQLASERRLQVILCYIPTKAEFTGSTEPYSMATKAVLQARSAEAGVGFLDLTPALSSYRQATGRQPYFRYDDHWNKDGHAAVAAALARRVSSQLPATVTQ